MAYLGASGNISNIQKLDSIIFDSVTNSFPMKVGGNLVSIASPLGLIISVGGVIQEPYIDYVVTGSNLIFTTAPLTGLPFFGVALGKSIDIGTVTDGSITNAKIGETISIAKGGTGSTTAAAARAALDIPDVNVAIHAATAKPVLADADELGVADSVNSFGLVKTTWSAINAAIGVIPTSHTNTRIGDTALQTNTTGTNNTAIGQGALYSNTSGGYNTASGQEALYSNTTGNYNTASGQNSLQANTTGGDNTASGQSALSLNTTGSYNTAIGKSALGSNTTGGFNTASGQEALFANTTGVCNTASGKSALRLNSTGSYNTAIGQNALSLNTTGVGNTASGQNALQANTTGSGNTAINPLSSTGVYAPVFNPTTENNRLCMGSTSVTNAYIQVAWTVVSDARDKTDFAPVPHGLDFVKKLKTTAYRYKMARADTEGHGPVRYGFKAQDVLDLEGDNPVIVDAEDAEKLRFNDQAMIAVLVNALQELNAKFDAYVSTHP